jgi:alkaline phosphatase
MGKMNPAFTAKSNTAQMTPVFAFGPGAELFSGILDNTEIYHRIRLALGWN